jgi:hypothetical protein
MKLKDTNEIRMGIRSLSHLELDAVAGGFEGQVLWCEAPAPHIYEFIRGFYKGGGTTNGCPGGWK